MIIFLDNNIQINVDRDKYQVYSIDKHIIDMQNALHGNTYLYIRIGKYWQSFFIT